MENIQRELTRIEQHGIPTRITLAVGMQATALPVAVGFGVTTPAQARAIADGADGVAVGSALVNAIRDSLGPTGGATGKTVSNVLDLVKNLSGALRPA